jgi:nicotinamidase-related amidase
MIAPLSSRSVHLCVDMQCLFAEGRPWHTPWLARVLPKVVELAEHSAEQTVFTRFIPPATAHDAPGRWQLFYRRWPEVTLERLDPADLELLAPLKQFVPPALVIDKSVYSPFYGLHLNALLARRGIDSVVFSGTETDVCILSGVMDAVDLGLRVVVAEDAVCSSNDDTHDALMKLYRRRFQQQIEIASVAEIIAQWERRA